MRLLLAEDEKMLSSVLVTILKKNNYSVDAVFNGSDAVKCLETNVYDGAILDIMMPKLDGITVLQTIREQGNTVPVLMLTAKSEVDDKVCGLDSGANDYLSKPFDTRELLARIRAMTKNQASPPKPELTCGNVTLNHTTLEIKSETNSFRLSNKEFQLMELFLRHPGCHVNRQQLSEQLCSDSSQAEAAAVEMYISFLTKKLKALQADVHILALGSDFYILEKKNYDR